MKKILISLGIGTALGALIATFLILSFNVNQIPENHVRITIQNKSDYMIKELQLVHQKGENTSTWIKQDSEITNVFYCGGENALKIKVLFDNDSVLTSKEIYIEPGYDITEIITNKSIVEE